MWRTEGAADFKTVNQALVKILIKREQDSCCVYEWLKTALIHINHW